MGPFGVYRMMKKGHYPILFCVLYIGQGPVVHGAPNLATRMMGIQYDKMDVGIIKGIIGLCSRGSTSGLGSRWEGKYIIVGTGLCSRIGRLPIVVSQAGPCNGFFQHIVINVEQGILILLIRTTAIGVIP